MSGRASLFAGQGRVESSEFRYDPHRQNKSPAPQQSPFSFQSQVFAYKVDSATRENTSLGGVLFLIRPGTPGYQLMVYQNQNSPLIALR
jgi:hypothetical protein